MRRLAGRGPGLAIAVFVASTVVGAGQDGPAGAPRADFTPTAASGSISGIVVSDAAAILPGADILLSSVLNGASRTATADASGRFVFADVAAGRYTLGARLDGFVTMAYGATRAHRPGMTVVVAGAQPVSGLSIVLPRVASIAGVVTTPDGTPAHLVRVTAISATTARGGWQPVTWGSTATNAKGEFRLDGLPPGGYRIRASVPYQDPSGKAAPLRAVFYPDVVDEADAAVVAVASGEDRPGINLTLQQPRLARIHGTVLNMPPDTAPALFLFPEGMESSVTTPDRDGRFTFTGVPPGAYTIESGLVDTPPQFFVPDKNGPPGSVKQPLLVEKVAVGQFAPRILRMIVTNVAGVGSWGRAEVRVDGYDIDGLVIDLRKTVSVRGRVVVDAPASASRAVPQVIIGLTTPDDLQHLQDRLGSSPAGSRRLLRATPDATGAFAFQPVVPSRFRVEVSRLPGSDAAAWFLKSVTVGGRDVTDIDFDIAPDRTVSDLVVTVTAQTQTLTGTLLDESGLAPTNLSLVVFSADPRLWVPHSRRVRIASRATDGSFEIADLPAGDYYLAAFSGSEPDVISDAGFLEPLVAGAIPLTLGSGEHKVQHLRLAGR